jgi:hypothetical protein
MDCIACGKPISITAKFCGKCGAPAKRSAKPVEAPVAAEVSFDPTPTLTPTVSSAETAAHQVDEMTFKLSPPEHMPDMRDINLDLPDTVVEALVAVTAPAPPPAAKETSAPGDSDRPKVLDQTQQEIKKILEKHSLLLDFISLTSQQQSHQQNQPNPLEHLVTQVAEQQTSLQSQLTQLAALMSQNEAHQHSQRMPDEFKLQLEKQKIEIHKLMAQSLGQNNENFKEEQHEVIEHLEKSIEAYHQAAQQSLEKNMGALAAGMNELKSQLQVLQKKTVEKTFSKSRSSSDSDSETGSFMIFVIGLLCGLTVVLSSLAIYNFLSHETTKTESPSKADTADKHAPDDKHEAPAKAKSD